ncbi:MAG TPA: hypothetical protein VMH00_05400 [Candidatus Limnocylindrales bacterium]|nr:hypothetical protein [Candidatus Limnocylindrales bacterium]
MPHFRLSPTSPSWISRCCRRLTSSRAIALCTAAIILAAVGCSKGHSPSEAPSVSSAGVPSSFHDLRDVPGTVFDVTYTPNTVPIDLPTVQKTLRSVSPDGIVFLFDASDPRIRSLGEGKVMFLEHLGVRRVVGVSNQGSNLAVVTEEASLGDFIQNGHIQFSVPIKFTQANTQALPVPSQPSEVAALLDRIFSPALVYASEGNKGAIAVHVKGEINNWEFVVEGEPEGEGFSLSLEAGKKLAGISASIKAKGELQNITTKFNAVINGSTVQQFEYSTPLNGKMHVSWAALTSGENSGIGEARLKLPPFAKDVFDVYGLPLLFRIDESLIFKPGFGTKKDAASGGFDLEYNGTGGLSVSGAGGQAQSTPEGSMTGEPTAQDTTAESLAAHGIVLAVDAPKVSVSIGTESITEAIQEAVPGAILDKAAEGLEKLGLGGLIKKAKEDFFKIEGAAYLQMVTEFDYAGSGPMSLVPCTMTHLNFYAQAGVDGQLLGVKGESPHLDLYKTSKAIRNPDIDACGQK